MDLALSAEQAALRETFSRIAAAHNPGTPSEAPDAAGALLHQLDQAGFADLLAPQTPDSLLTQVLVLEVLARSVPPLHLAGLALGAKLQTRHRCVAWQVSAASPVRRGHDVDAVVRVADAAAVCEILRHSDVRVRWGDPFVSVDVAPGQALDVAGTEIRRWYRLALCAEGVGAAGAALELTISYLRGRQQFGAPLAERQSLRHGLVELSAEVEAARWLMYEAAWSETAVFAGVASAAMAAATLVTAARRLVPDLHRYAGALGFSTEYPLHRLTGRLRSVAAELGSAESLAVEAHDERASRMPAS